MTSPAPDPSTPAGTTPATSALLGAVQDALAAEYAAVWSYPVLGARLTDPDRVAQARAGDDAHAVLVADVVQRLTAAGRTPVAPRTDYPVPSPLDPTAFAVAVEERTAAAWREVVVRAADGTGGTDGTDVGGFRALAVTELAAAAVRAAGWRRVAAPDAGTVAFPGV